MNMKWVSKDDGSFHIHVGALSLCKTKNLVKPFGKKFSFGNNKEEHCKICTGIIRTDQIIKIKKSIEQSNQKLVKFYQKFEIHPVDALVNMLSLENATLEDIEELSAKDFGGISPVDVLADAIKSKKVYFEDNGVICPNNRGKIL